MKKTFFVIFVLISSLITFSCDNAPSGIVLNYDSDTLRSLSNVKESSVSWTKEIEGVEEPDFSKAPESFSLSKDIMAINVADTKPIYPYLADFGSLDTTEISEDIFTLLETFFTEFSQGKNVYSTLCANRSYVPYVLKYQLALFVSFDSKIYGKPYISYDIQHPVCEIPVRLFKDSASVDLIINLIPVTSDYTGEEFLLNTFLIDQIRVGDIQNG